MKKDLIFFSTEGGLTSTSANHIANLAKEHIQSIDRQLSNITLYSTSIGLIDSNDFKIIENGWDEGLLNTIPNLLQQKAEASSLIAWLREAIKAKDRLKSEIDRLSVEQFGELEGITIPLAPVRKASLTADEYYAGLSVKERNRYYELETEASVIGKVIHNNGEFAAARDRLKIVIVKPTSVTGSGRDSLITSYTPTVNVEKVEDVFFKLQARHREVQAQLNSIKFECDKATSLSDSEVQAEYIKDYSDYRNVITTINNNFVKYKQDTIAKILELKIIIPDSLKTIYDSVRSLGKE